MVLFNMLPAFPMDGGRVLRAVLAFRMDYVRATQIAAGMGQAMAFAFGFLGLLGNPFLLFIALFVWMGAQQEAALVSVKAGLSGIPVSYCMVTRYRSLSPDDTLKRAAEETLAGFQQDFPVVEGDKVAGVLTQGDLFAALARQDIDAPVSSVMKRDFQVAYAGEMLESAFLRLQDCNCRTMPVLRDNRLVGLLTMSNLGEFLSIQAALNQGKRGVRGTLFDHPGMAAPQLEARKHT
jgi:CBS domain-containing protein